MTTRRRLAATAVRVLAWVLLVVGLSVIAVPSLRNALFWLGVMAIARGIARFAAREDASDSGRCGSEGASTPTRDRQGALVAGDIVRLPSVPESG
jgi:hypothetical protein